MTIKLDSVNKGYGSSPQVGAFPQDRPRCLRMPAILWKPSGTALSVGPPVLKRPAVSVLDCCLWYVLLLACPKGSCSSTVYTWALEGFLYPYFGTMYVLRPLGCTYHGTYCGTYMMSCSLRPPGFGPLCGRCINTCRHVPTAATAAAAATATPRTSCMQHPSPRPQIQESQLPKMKTTNEGS